MKKLILGFGIFTGIMAFLCFIFGDFLRAAFYVILTGLNHWSYNNFNKAEEIRKEINERIAQIDKKIDEKKEKIKEIEKELEELEKDEKEDKNN